MAARSGSSEALRSPGHRPRRMRPRLRRRERRPQGLWHGGGGRHPRRAVLAAGGLRCLASEPRRHRPRRLGRGGRGQLLPHGQGHLGPAVSRARPLAPLSPEGSPPPPRKQPPATPSAEGPRDEASTDSPAPSWSFTSGPAAAPVRNRWAFFARGADCLVLHVVGPKDDAFADRTFESASASFQALPLPAERQREIDLLAGYGFLERRDPVSALDRFEALTQREPENAKANFGALMAGFELGAPAYARALPHGKYALRGEHDLTSEQRQLALRAMGVMQLAENHVKEAADTLAELVVRAPDLAEGQYNFACALARLGDNRGAFDHLKAAVRLDGELAAHARADDDLKSLRGSADFERLTSPSAPK